MLTLGSRPATLEEDARWLGVAPEQVVQEIKERQKFWDNLEKAIAPVLCAEMERRGVSEENVRRFVTGGGRAIVWSDDVIDYVVREAVEEFSNIVSAAKKRS